jgi:hypothetical protein
MYKYPQLYHDMISFYNRYWRNHQHLPKSFRITTGDEILRLLTDGLGQVAVANYAGKSLDERLEAASALQKLRQSIEKIRALVTLAWNLKFISHQTMHELNEGLNQLGRQAAKWRDWLIRNKNI